MINKWKGIKEIVEKATKELNEKKVDGYLFYSAPKGYRLFLSFVTIDYRTRRFKINDFGIALNGKKNRILGRGYSEGYKGIFIDDNNEPLLELVEGMDVEPDEIRMRIKEERMKSRSIIQVRKYTHNVGG